jgi:hypothetical protein
MITDIGEYVRVKAVFSRGRVEILAVMWNGRLIPVRQVTHRWETKEGKFPLYHFAAVSDGMVMELCLDPVRLSWTLDRIHTQ